MIIGTWTHSRQKRGSLWVIGLILMTLVLCAFTGVARAATTYDIGPGQPYTTIGSFPWMNLQGGDTVRIHYSPQPYKEMIVIGSRGTPEAPIKIVGVPGPQGQRPVIDGNGATIGPNLHYYWPGSPTQVGTPNRGLITVTLTKEHSWGFKPGFIEISGLEVQGAHPDNSFTDNLGNVRPYGFVAGIYVERGDNITVRDCVFHNNGLGFFVQSTGTDATTSTNILFERNTLYDNGVLGNPHYHQTYTEANGIIIQYNHFLSPIHTDTVSSGGNIKDRSAGTVIRYNYIEDGLHLIALLEPQDGYPILGNLPSYHQSFVYGNVLVNNNTVESATRMIRYGGDQYVYPNYRNGTLYFYNNTVVNRVDQRAPNGGISRWSTLLFLMDDNNQIVDMRNNLIYNEAISAGANRSMLNVIDTAGVVNFSGPNWLSPTWTTSDLVHGPMVGTVSGQANLISPASNNPGFVDPVHDDFRLASGSPAIDQSGPLDPAAASYLVTEEYVKHLSSQPRPVSGAAADLGAWEADGTPAAPIAVTGVALNVTSWRNYAPATVQLTAAIAPFLANNKQVTWTSSNPAVATVTSAGLVKAVGGGNATVTVTTVDGGFTATSQITVPGSSAGGGSTGSSNANLAGLTLSAGAFAPAFSPATASYTLNVPNTSPSTTVTATPQDSGATYKVNGLPPGSQVGYPGTVFVPLFTGTNTISVVVRAANGTTSTYSVTVNRAESSDATLKALTVQEATAPLTLTAGQTAYAVTVPAGTPSVTLTATASKAKSKITVGGVPITGGQATSVALTADDTTLDIGVLAADGVTTLMYHVSVHRLP